MTSEFEEAAEITQIARQYRELSREGSTWSGGPVSPEILKAVADEVTQHMHAGTLLEGLGQSSDPAGMLQGLLAIAWAQGFNVGAMYAERRSGS